MHKFLTLFCFFLLTITSFGQTKQNKQLVKNLDELITEKYKSITPGCVILVARNGQIVYDKGFGTANIELNVQMQPEMIFRIGSITKQFTAVAILQLVQQGKISLQDSIQKCIKDFPYKGHVITIENLLTQTSGIVDYEVLDFHIPNAIRVDFSSKQIIDSLAKLPLDFIPSTKYNYSNSNYFLLSYIIEQVSGKSYEKYVQENIFNIAGLSHTFYDNPIQIINNRINGYSKDSTSFHNADYISMTQVAGAGALLSSADDLFKWHQALYSNKLLKKETLQKAFTPFTLSDRSQSEYGYGWFIKDWKGSKSIGHGGAIDGFRSMETYFPDKDIYIAGLCNSDDDNFFNLVESVADIAIGKPSENEYTNVKVDENILNSYSGIYKFIEDTTQFIKIYKEGDNLFADLSNKTGMHMPLVAQTQTFFNLPIIKRIPTTIEFIVEDGKVKGLYWTQEKKHETRKTE